MTIKKKNTTSFEEHLTKEYGNRGTPERTEYQIKATGGKAISSYPRCTGYSKSDWAKQLSLQ